MLKVSTKKKPLGMVKKLPKFRYGKDLVSFWALDVLDRKDDGKYAVDFTGENVNVYILDSGLTSKHPGFPLKNARVVWAKDNDFLDGDCEGHGSHLAGIVVGSVAGVAKRAQVHMLRIMGCVDKFSSGDFIRGLQHLKTIIKYPAIISLSLGSDKKAIEETDRLKIISLLNEFTQKLNVPVIVSSGNSGEARCESMYEGVKDLIVVGSADSDYRISKFSNFGECVDFYGPGENIWSHSNETKNFLYRRKRGSSQATPFVAGISALLMEIEGRQVPPKELKLKLMRQSEYRVELGDRMYPFVYVPLSQKTTSKLSVVSSTSQKAESDKLLIIIGSTTALAVALVIGILLCVYCGKRKAK